jgi:hypothetical protein
VTGNARQRCSGWTRRRNPFLAAADTRDWLTRLARFAFSVEADFSLWRVCRAYPADRYTEQAQTLLDDRSQSAAAFRSYLHGLIVHYVDSAQKRGRYGRIGRT